MTAEQKSLSDRLKVELGKISKLLDTDLSRRSTLGAALSFEEIESSIRMYGLLFLELDSYSLEHISSESLKEVVAEAEKYKSLLETIRNFKIDRGSPSSNRTNIIRRANLEGRDYVKVLAPILHLLKLSQPKEITNKTSAEQLMTDITEVKKTATTVLSEITETAKQAQDTVNSIGVSKYATVFSDESDKHKDIAKRWFIAMVVVILIIVASSILLVVCVDEPSNNYMAIQLAIMKVVVVSSLFYILAVFNRNYKAHKHNEVVNKHRQNALTTFQAFTQGAGEDIQTKNAILITATQSIFGSQRTGYSSNDSDSESSNRIIEIIKDSTKQSHN